MTNSSSPTPKLRAIEPASNTQLSLNWDNDTAFKLDYKKVRFLCPCAVCVNEISGKRQITPEQIPDDVAIRDVEPVGHYALRITFSDQHQTGIYTFDYLHQICTAHSKGENHES